ncbi:MAG: hypothetical protein OEO84_15660 [Betaproteobacteria bacterium]|nr:hypothetical protein [Betaproteobacteria bacterium]
MILTHVSLVFSGIACLSLASFMIYAAMPREGKPASLWTATESRSTLLALSIVTLFVFGLGLVLKGILT